MSAVFKKLNTAVITGGASGIGLALAQKCVGYGMRVLVADWDAENLEAARTSLGQGASTIQMDVSKFEDWGRLKAKVVQDFGGQINLLALNAGVGGPISFDDADPSGFRRVLDVNVHGVANGIAALVPLAEERATPASPAAVVVTGSKQGITNPPGNPAYNASKAAVKALAEHLAYDLRSRADSVAVHLLIPGWTWTRLAGAAAGGGPKPPGAWTPAQVADYLERAVAERRFWVLCPDNDVTEDMDRKRMLWTANDAVKGRPPLSRWRDEFKDEFAAWMERDDL